MILACYYCATLLAEMHSCNAEARAIQQDLKMRTVSGGGINHNFSEWYQLASDRWTNAAADLSEHLVTHRWVPTTTTLAHN
jgi:hypothetical protein